MFLSIDFVSNVDIMLKNSGFKIAFFMTVYFECLIKELGINNNTSSKTTYKPTSIENRRLNDNVFDLMVDIEELEQYGRRNSLRFHNVPITKEELNKTDDKIVDICEQHLKIDITSDDINRSHIIGKIHHVLDTSCCLYLVRSSVI
jgi:deoxyhypusine synthase